MLYEVATSATVTPVRGHLWIQVANTFDWIIAIPDSQNETH